MTIQTSILDLIAEGEILANAGLQKAVDHADATQPGWSERAWNLFVGWIQTKPAGYLFMVEDFRRAVEDKIEQPPSKRAYGFISKRAFSKGLISFNRIKKVNNHKAHSANAAEWRVI